MTAQNQAYQNYLHQDVMTASPQKLVFMLYDRAIFNLKEVIKAIEAGNIEARHSKNKKAFDIIAHMWQTLDMERGGEVSKNLEQLYSYILRRLPDVDFKNDPEAAREVIGLLTPLRDSWAELANNPDKYLKDNPGAQHTSNTIQQKVSEATQSLENLRNSEGGISFQA